MKKIFVTVLLIGVLFISGCASQTGGTQTNQTQLSDNTQPAQQPSGGLTGTTLPPPADTPPTPPTVSLTELATHNSASDCWVAYDGKVYDITSYLLQHPGGADKITPYCGTSGDFTGAFMGQHGTSQVSGLMAEGILKGNLV